jgi:hypothetical protein
VQRSRGSGNVLQQPHYHLYPADGQCLYQGLDDRDSARGGIRRNVLAAIRVVTMLGQDQTFSMLKEKSSEPPNDASQPVSLLLKVHRRPANSLCLEVHGHLDTVCDLDEGNAAVHPVILTVESHCPFDRA